MSSNGARRARARCDCCSPIRKLALPVRRSQHLATRRRNNTVQHGSSRMSTCSSCATWRTSRRSRCWATCRTTWCARAVLTQQCSPRSGAARRGLHLQVVTKARRVPSPPAGPHHRQARVQDPRHDPGGQLRARAQAQVADAGPHRPLPLHAGARLIDHSSAAESYRTPRCVHHRCVPTWRRCADQGQPGQGVCDPPRGGDAGPHRAQGLHQQHVPC